MSARVWRSLFWVSAPGCLSMKVELLCSAQCWRNIS
jgi:hypothetical protein